MAANEGGDERLRELIREEIALERVENNVHINRRSNTSIYTEEPSK